MIDLAQLKQFLQNSYPKTILSPLGIQVDIIDPDKTQLSLTIDDRHRQHVGLVHGGVHLVLAETAASIAATAFVNDLSKSVVGIDINASHLRAKRDGILKAISKRIHGGRKTCVYEVGIRDESDHLISICRCTLLILGESSSSP